MSQASRERLLSHVFVIFDLRHPYIQDSIRFRPTIYQRSECVDVYMADSGRGGGCYFIESVHGCICHLDELRHHKVLGVWELSYSVVGDRGFGASNLPRVLLNVDVIKLWDQESGWNRI